MTDNILEMRSITKTFPGVKALQDVSLDVRRGEIHAICGENGAGKSTLMKVLSGVYHYGSYECDIVYERGVGKQQLIEIAKALSKEVKLLILDEPTAALNDQDSEHLLGLLRQLNAQG